MVSAPVGFGRLHVSPLMAAYLQRYPDVSAELRLEDRIVNLIEDGIDLAVRIGFLGDSSLVARHVGEMRRIVVAAPSYLKQHGEPKTPAEVATHQTIQFGSTAVTGEWRFVEAGREIRLNITPRFSSNGADAAVQYAEQGGGLTRVLAYQAADALRRGALKIVLHRSSSRRCRSTSSTRRRGCCRPRCAVLSISSPKPRSGISARTTIHECGMTALEHRGCNRTAANGLPRTRAAGQLQQSSMEVKMDIRSALKELCEAFNAHDLDRVMALLF